MHMEKCTSECKLAAGELNILLAIVDAIQASSLEVREARSKLLRQIFKVMYLVDNRMIEAMDFREMKKQNAPRRLQPVKAQVKTARQKDLAHFRQHIIDKVAKLHAQVSMVWDTQAMHEGR